jgi:hypothetical protein
MATQKRLLVRLSPELKTQLEERSRKDRGTQSENLEDRDRAICRRRYA